MSYYGETECLCYRYTAHLRELKEKTHHNKSLLKAYQEHPNRFRFFILDYGPQWKNKTERVKRQNQYILANLKKSYNAKQTVKKRSIKPVMLNGTYYSSEREASREANIARSTLKRYLTTNTNPNIFYLKDQEKDYGFIPIFAKRDGAPSVLFNSFAECISAGFATNTQNARRKIQRNVPGWRYAHVDRNGKPLRTPYILKEGEISYKEYKKLKMQKTA
uniref:Putative GIY-YIG homing endonuclease n=1 Tax=Jenufa minuta TaxID=993092 RepID=A0A0S2LP38_JENMI|nr:putative GIY-YIG homing endonuclease [Jenufa minuta]ALO63001.1 putative GIY-YIG homing endonuclease [Jenufa minuta]